MRIPSLRAGPCARGAAGLRASAPFAAALCSAVLIPAGSVCAHAAAGVRAFVNTLLS